jgi:hypothetical protein
MSKVTTLPKILSYIIPESMREFFSPVTVRFMKTDDLQETMEFLEAAANKPWLERSDSVDEMVTRMQILIGRELLRRNVRFWREW